MLRSLRVLVLTLLAASALEAAEPAKSVPPPPPPPPPVPKQVLVNGETFLIAGRPAFVMLPDAAGVMMALNECRAKHAGANYIRLSAFDNTYGWVSLRMSFITDRPANEPGFALERQERGGRNIAYTTRSYSADKPEGERYA